MREGRGDRSGRRRGKYQYICLLQQVITNSILSKSDPTQLPTKPNLAGLPLEVAGRQMGGPMIKLKRIVVDILCIHFEEMLSTVRSDQPVYPVAQAPTHGEKKCECKGSEHIQIARKGNGREGTRMESWNVLESFQIQVKIVYDCGKERDDKDQTKANVATITYRNDER